MPNELRVCSSQAPSLRPQRRRSCVEPLRCRALRALTHTLVLTRSSCELLSEGVPLSCRNGSFCPAFIRLDTIRLARTRLQAPRVFTTYERSALLNLERLIANSSRPCWARR